MTDTVREIYADEIRDPQDAMRSELDRDALFDLAESIKQNGLINPITVRPIADGFEVVAGHRRFSACKIAGKIKIPCVIRDLDDQQTFEVMAAENLERQDVDPVDEAIFITRFMERTGKSPAEIAKALKRSEAWVRNRLAIGEMPEYMQTYLKNGALKIGVALTLVQIDDEQTRRLWTEQAVRDGASIGQAEHWLYEYRRQCLPGGTLSDTPPSDYVPGTPQTVTLECAIDGQKYDSRMFRSVLIYEGNMDYFREFVSAFTNAPPESGGESGG